MNTSFHYYQPAHKKSLMCKIKRFNIKWMSWRLSTVLAQSYLVAVKEEEAEWNNHYGLYWTLRQMCNTVYKERSRYKITFSPNPLLHPAILAVKNQIILDKQVWQFFFSTKMHNMKMHTISSGCHILFFYTVIPFCPSLDIHFFYQ